ncbi:MAG: hypothetical protein AABZ30_06325 [Myxococcota bacterium]
MSVEKRKKLVRDLEQAIEARVLCFVTGDRSSLETMIAGDAIPLVSEHLARIGHQERLAIFLYTVGGDPVAGRSLVDLATRYCGRLVVAVPFRALSCGTLIALGANELLLGRHAQLSPVDPSVSSPYSPAAPGSPSGGAARLPVSVEDMIGFLDLAREEAGIKSEAHMIEVLKLLASHVHPLALGAVFRARKQNAALASKVMRVHDRDASHVRKVVHSLTRGVPSHGYLIGREEAKTDLKLPLRKPTANQEQILWDLYVEYRDWFQLTRPPSPALDLGSAPRAEKRYERAAIESLDGNVLTQHVFVTQREILRVPMPQAGVAAAMDQVIERVLFEGWLPARDGSYD